MNTTIKHKKSTIISDGSDKPRSKKSAHYVSNSDLYDEFVKWNIAIEEAKLLNKEEPTIPDKIGYAFIQIATNLAKKANWISNTKYKDEMIGDAIENCCKCARNFNPELTKNPFAYFTQTCYYAFLRRIKDEKVEDYVKGKSMMNSIMFNESAEFSSEDEELLFESIDFNQAGMEDFIRDFEEKNFGRKLDADKIAGIGGKPRNIETPADPKNLGFL